MTEEKQITLLQLLDRVEKLEKELAEIKEKKPAGKAEVKGGKKAVAKVEAKPAGIKKLLKELAEAKEKGDKKLSFKLRVKLRKAGYSLRDNNKE